MAEPLSAGIYRVCDAAAHTSFIGYTYNLRGILKRFRFELGLNVCTFKPLQLMYNAAGGRVSMEILEEISGADANDEKSEELLKAALHKWKKSLEDAGETVKIIML